MNNKIIITGATGLIGRELVKKLIDKKYEILVFSRNVEKARKILPFASGHVEWDYKNSNEWISYLDNAYAIIHLAGINLFQKRWNENFKKDIYESRVISTKKIYDSIRSIKIKPEVFISSSGVGFYGNCGNNILTERSPAGDDFLARVCINWENESKRFEDAGIRNVQLRTGLVLSKNDGALNKMLPFFRLFIGGPFGNGEQWTSWIHIDDIVNSFIHALENNSVRGPVNAVSPHSVKNKLFASALGKVINRPSIFPVPKFVLKTAIGEAADVVTASQRAIPEILINSGFKFKFEKLETALKDLLK